MPTQCPGSQFAVRGRTGQFAPMAARFARAHRKDSARARRGTSEARLKFFGEVFFKKALTLPLTLLGGSLERN